jgi:hypothetical protein
MLKLVSRLFAHELHAQQNSKTVTLSRDEVVEMHTVLDLFIEEVSRRPAGSAPLPAADVSVVVGARNN